MPIWYFLQRSLAAKGGVLNLFKLHGIILMTEAAPKLIKKLKIIAID